ncbi:hypothetical protein A6302_02478 [Methylobrevis pamukkalensis]|uniref:Uncharacterized protein n=1 Tax=Methylobrevis pamukkalensis TaxID=1439726 RepID=A0A1E3H1N7_9HYPH|nr:hypothetical protein A6302_02478 [Methylobrevis pamukkalensis]
MRRCSLTTVVIASSRLAAARSASPSPFQTAKACDLLSCRCLSEADSHRSKNVANPASSKSPGGGPPSPPLPLSVALRLPSALSLRSARLSLPLGGWGVGFRQEPLRGVVNIGADAGPAPPAGPGAAPPADLSAGGADRSAPSTASAAASSGPKSAPPKAPSTNPSRPISSGGGRSSPASSSSNVAPAAAMSAAVTSRRTRYQCAASPPLWRVPVRFSSHPASISRRSADWIVERAQASCRAW